MKKIYVWCGSGYLLDEIDVTDYLGDRTDISIEEVAYLCVKKNCGYVITTQTYDELLKESVYYDKVDLLTAEEMLNETWCYCDLTTFDDVPEEFKVCFINTENMSATGDVEIHS